MAYGTGGAEIMRQLHSRKEFKNVLNLNISKYAQDKNQEGKFMESEGFESYIKEVRPNVLITERSNGLAYHHSIERLCKKLGITTICVLDLNLGAGGRFKEEPDYILVPSESIYKEVVRSGIEREKVFVCGNPAFDYIQELNYSREVNRDIPRILYVSQGMTYQHRFNDVHRAICKEYSEFSIEVKLHPQEDEYNTYEYTNYKNTTIVSHDNKKEFLNRCLEYDLVVGVGSTIQIKTNLIGIPTLFVNSENDLEDMIKRFKDSVKLPDYIYSDFEKDATTKVISKIKQLVNMEKSSCI